MQFVRQAALETLSCNRSSGVIAPVTVILRRLCDARMDAEAPDEV